MMDSNNYLQFILSEIAEDDNVINNMLPLAVDLVMSHNIIPLISRREIAHPRNEHYFEETVPIYNLSDFKSHFRMSPNVMEVMIQTVGRRLENVHHVIPIEKKCHFTLWMLSKPETFLAAGDRFNFAKSTGHDVFTQVVNALSQCVNEYIVWPNAIRQQEITQAFQARSRGFPGIVGVLDATHINIIQPKNNAMDYYNRKQVHSVILQAVCDENCKFINVSTGYPGRLHDARVFRNSGLCGSLDELINNSELHLIGDEAYPLKENLMTPYRNNGHLRPNEIEYNRKLSSVRSTIERSFSRLKGKFRRLKLLELTTLELISSTIIVCCILHNMILDNDSLNDDEDEVEDDPDDPDDVHRPGTAQMLDRQAIMKRNYLASII